MPYDPVAVLLSLSPHTLCVPFAANLAEEEDGTGSVEANDPVGWINDLTGNGHIPIQETLAARPIYNPSGGLHLLTCDGTDDQLRLNFANLAQPFEIVAGLRIVTSSGSETMIGGGATNNFGAIFIDGSNVNLFAGSVMTGPVQPANGVDFVVTAKFNGASSRVKIDEGAYSIGNAGASAMTGLSIGTGVGSGFANMLFYVVMLRSGEMTDGQIAQAIEATGVLLGRPAPAQPVFADSVDGGGGRGKQKALPYWWHSWLAQQLDELEEREAEYRRIKAEMDALHAAERARKALLNIEARKIAAAQIAAEQAAWQAKEDARLAKYVAGLRSERDEQRRQDDERVQGALAAAEGKRERARADEEAEEIGRLRKISRSGAQRFGKRFEAAIEVLRRQGWRAKN